MSSHYPPEFIKQKSIDLRLPEEKIQMLCEAFELFDFSNDGNIGSEELYLVYNALGRNISKEEVAEIIKNIEDEKNQKLVEEGKFDETKYEEEEGEGELDIEEFLTLMSQEIHEEIERKEKDELQEAFERFGVDTKGGPKGITKKQIVETMERYGEKLSEA